MTRESKTVNVGVIGVGIGEAHLNGYNLVQEANVIALCDLDKARAEASAAKCNLPNASIYTDYKELLKNPDLDAVSVCLPNFLHHTIAIEALQAGKHVICEKPLTMTPTQAEEIVAASEKAGKFCMVGQVNRFREDSQYLKQLITDGKLGDIYYAQCGWMRRSGIPGYGGWFTTKSKSGGGPLIDIGVHLLDLTWWFAGCPKPVSVSGVTYAEMGPRKRGLAGMNKPGTSLDGTFDVEDLAVALIRFENGLTINLQVSWALYDQGKAPWSNIYGTEGGASWGKELVLHTDLNGKPADTNIAIKSGGNWAGEMQHFIDSILSNTPPDPSADQGLTMMKMLEAIYKSAESGHEVLVS